LNNIVLTPSRMSPTNEVVTLLFANHFNLEFDEYNDIVFYQTSNIIYVTTGEENGLNGTFMYIEGVVTSFLDAGDLEGVIIQTDEFNQREIILGFPRSLFELAVEYDVLTEPFEFDLLERSRYNCQKLNINFTH